VSKLPTIPTIRSRVRKASKKYRRVEGRPRLSEVPFCTVVCTVLHAILLCEMICLSMVIFKIEYALYVLLQSPASVFLACYVATDSENTG
jgi:hypothetical protein